MITNLDHIEELHAELRGCLDPAERANIAAELETAMSSPSDAVNGYTINIVFEHGDGDGFNLKLDYLPLNGADIVIRKPRPGTVEVDAA